MAAKVQDYVKAIQKEKQEALEKGYKEITIRSGDLHKQINKGTPTLVTCCMAMKKMMLEEDLFIQNPENKSGASAQLTIQYLLHDLDSRMPLITAKQRGRKKGSTIAKKEEKKSSLQEALEAWLLGMDLNFETNKNILQVQGAYGTWRIRIAMARGRRPFNLDDAVYSLLKSADEGTDKYSICMNASKENQKEWDKVSTVLKKKMNITALFVRDGQITEK